MTTNSKHYEILAIEPWDIMKANFTTEEFVAYLKGNIIKYTLRDKGQALTDAQKIKHYSEKLIEVLEKDKEPEDKHKFKVGDRVRTIRHDEKGTIIRTPVEGLREVDKKCYIIELDDKNNGWKATKEKHLVDNENAWYVDDTDIELLPKKTLAPNKWYDAEDFTVEELKELLPVGTKVIVIEDYTTNSKNAVEFARETWIKTTVQNIGKRTDTGQTRVGITRDIYFRRYFSIVEEY